MISYISSWSEQVIIAVIIGTIIEIILPKGNSKKYIKTVIGIYILYVIISPIIPFKSGDDLKLNYSEYESYFTNYEDYRSIENKFSVAHNGLIESAYKEEIKNQLKKDVEELGFKVTSISIQINSETGELINLSLLIDKEKENYFNNIEINKIEIGEKNKTSENNLSRQEIEKIKKMIENDYSLSYENIKINSI